jgi:hypothetical protein
MSAGTLNGKHVRHSRLTIGGSIKLASYCEQNRKLLETMRLPAIVDLCNKECCLDKGVATTAVRAVLKTLGIKPVRRPRGESTGPSKKELRDRVDKLERRISALEAAIGT